MLEPNLVFLLLLLLLPEPIAEGVLAQLLLVLLLLSRPVLILLPHSFRSSGRASFADCNEASGSVLSLAAAAAKSNVEPS